MKKLLFSFLGLILCSFLAWGAESVTIKQTSKQLADKYELPSGDQLFQSFNLDENISVVSTANENGYYSSGSECWHIYQNRGNGEFTISAANGYWIQSIKITWKNKNTDDHGVLSFTPGKNRSEADQIASNVSTSINKQSITLYVGNKNDEKGGQVRISEFSVTYIKVPTSVSMVSKMYVNKDKTINLIANALPTDAYTTVTWKSDDENIATVDANGIVTGIANGEVNITAKTLNGLTATCKVVVTTDLSVVESFAKCTTMTSFGQQVFDGDNSSHSWTIKNAKKHNGAVVAGLQGIELQPASNAYIYESALEGGIKHISFLWTATSSTLPVNFEMDNGTNPSAYGVNEAAGVINTLVNQYSMDVNYPSNSPLRFKMLTATGSSNVIVGPWTITPYLLFTNKIPSVDCKDGESFDLKKILINNTTSANTLSFEVSDNTTGGAATITDGVIDLSDVTTTGSMDITATWGQVSTTTTLSVTALPKPVITFADASVALNGNFVPQASVTVSGQPIQDATITYTSLDENVVKKDAQGNILLLRNGAAQIKASVAKKDKTYQAGEQTMTLTVTPFTPAENTFQKETFSNIPEKGGYTDNVESFDGDQQIYKWKANYYRRGSDQVSQEDATRYCANVKSYFESDGVLEGGIQYIMYNWRLAQSDEPTEFVQILVEAKNGEDEVLAQRLIDTTGVQCGGGYSFACAKRFDIPENVKIRVTVPKSGAAVVIGPITIVPYLLFKQKTADVNCKTTLSYNLNNIPIINNTGAAPIFSITSETGCTTADIKDGVLDLTNVHKTGDINITATWDNVTTTTKLVVTEAYSALPIGVTLNVGATMNATVDNKFQIIGKVEPAAANPTITWSSDKEDIVKVDQNGMLIVKAAGKATITATDIKGHATTCTITVAATTDGTFTETYQYLTQAEELQASAKSYTGTYKQGWRARNYYYSEATELSANVPGVILQGGATNFIAYNNAQVEGGVKRVSFDWRAVDGTKPVIFDIDSTLQDANVNLVSLPANGGFTEVQSFSRDVNLNQNMQFRIHVIDGTSSNIVFGPITVTPYLLYKNKTIELTPAQCAEIGYKYTNKDLIDNTGDHAITYSISGENNAKIAQLNTATGELSLIGKGKVKVTATWGKVSTSYTLEVKDKLTPTISEFSDTEIEIFGSYAPTPKFMIGDVELTDAEYTLSSGTPAVASVEENVFTIKKTGTSVITATLTGTDYYTTISPASTCTLTVTEPKDKEKYWKETFSKLETTDGYNKDQKSHPFNGDNDVLKWQVRNYQYTKTDLNKVNGENGIRIRNEENKNNYIAFAEPYEGGVKAVFFNWCIPGNSTITTDFTVSAGTYSKQVAVSAKPGEYYSFAENVVCETNSMFKITVNSDDKATVFGPITIEPYLLYTQKKCTVQLSPLPYINEDLINNTNQEGTVTYTLTDDNTPKIATINTSTGAVTMLNAGTVKVTATWSKGASTTYDLTIENKSDSHVETFNSSETTNYYCSDVTKKTADLAEWTYSIAGVQNGWSQFNGQNAIGIRAINADDVAANRESYIESSKISGGLSKLSFLWNLNGAENNAKWDIRFLVNGRLVRKLTSADITATDKMDASALVVIDDINEPGQFTLRIENHTTDKSGNTYATAVSKGRFVMDNLELLPYDGALELNEGQDNSLKISSHEDETMTVSLKRSLTAGMSNTFCVPFALSESQIDTEFGSDCKVLEFTGADLDDPKENLNINFKEVQAIEAGKPYFIEPAKLIENPTFEGVTIVNTTGETVGEDGDVQFVAIVNPTQLKAGDKTNLFLVANNRLAWSKAGDTSTMKGMRGYFKVPDNVDIKAAAARMCIVQVQTPTELDNANANVNANRKVIVNNQLIIIRGDKMYNAQGACLQ